MLLYITHQHVCDEWGQTFLLWIYLWLIFLYSLLSCWTSKAIFEHFSDLCPSPLPSPDHNNSIWEHGEAGGQRRRESPWEGARDASDL